MTTMDLLREALSGDAIGRLSRSVGASEDETRKAVSAAIPILLEALSRNASTQSGAASLLNVLDRDHDGSILDDVVGFLEEASTGDGEAILDHVLGGRRASVERGLSQASGIDARSVGRLLAMLAPIVLGAIGRMTRERKLDPSGLSKTFSQWSQTAEEIAPGALASVGQMLDADHDGQVMDDIAALGSSLAEAFLGKR
jgi:hypothetical protein